MLLVFLTQILNPYLSLNVSAPDNYTDDNFSHFFQIGIENTFSRKKTNLGVFLDYFYTKESAFNDPYFINSGLALVLNALGTGIQLKFLLLENIDFGLNFGYYAGKITFPIPGDSGRIIRKSDWRKSFGTTIATNLFQNFGKIKIGIKCYVNLIPFGARRPSEYIPILSSYYYSLDYVSLNSVGLGLVIGLNKKEQE